MFYSELVLWIESIVCRDKERMPRFKIESRRSLTLSLREITLTFILNIVLKPDHKHFAYEMKNQRLYENDSH